MEHLSKTQIILLCILLSFVISIATGIITVAMLSEAPAGVNQTINRVVERTIEKVIPMGNSKENVTNPTNNVDPVVDTIEKGTKGLVKITAITNPYRENIYYGLGTVVSSNGLVISAITYDFNALHDYSALLSDGKTYKLNVVSEYKGKDFVFFRIQKDSSDKTEFFKEELSSSASKLGESVVFVGGRDNTFANLARISEIIPYPANNDDPKVSKQSGQYLIKIDLGQKDDFSSGGPLLDLSGKFIGMKKFQPESPEKTLFYSWDLIAKEMQKIQ